MTDTFSTPLKTTEQTPFKATANEDGSMGSKIEMINEIQTPLTKGRMKNRLSAPPSLGILSPPDILKPDNKIRVITRIRPVSSKEKENGLNEIITPVLNTTEDELLSWEEESNLFSSIMSPSLQSKYEYKKEHKVKETEETLPTSLTIGTKEQKLFEFDAVLGPTISQQDVYNYTINKDSISNTLLKGINTTIIAYGQTGSGKTFTMDGYSSEGILHQGDTFYSPIKGSPKKLKKQTVNQDEDVLLNENDGIIPRAIYDLFTNIKTSGDIKITMTFVEIYNDEIYDLLSSSDEKQELEIRDYGENGIQIKNITIQTIVTVNDAFHYMNIGKNVRKTSSTKLNSLSSRSHSICTFYVDTCTAHSKLTLVDLAGSERLKKMGVVSGMQQQEGICINTDLFVLAKVISALSDKNNKDKRRRSSSSTLSSSSSSSSSTHIPYRDSKLTRILRDSLGGNCNTIMIACLSPTTLHYDESLNTLRYAARTRTITNVTFCNKKKNAKDVVALKKENKVLKCRLEDMTCRFHELEEQLKQYLNEDDTTVDTSNAIKNHSSSSVQQLRSITESNYEDDKENNNNNNITMEDHSIKDNTQVSSNNEHNNHLLITKEQINIEQQLLIELTMQNQELQEQLSTKQRNISDLINEEQSLKEQINRQQQQQINDIEILQNNMLDLYQTKEKIQTNVDFLLHQKELLQKEHEILYTQIDECQNALVLKQLLKQEKQITNASKIELQKQKVALHQLTKTLNNNTIQHQSQSVDYNKKIDIEMNKNKLLQKENKGLRKEIKFLSDERMMLLKKLDQLQEVDAVASTPVVENMAKNGYGGGDVENSSVIRKHANKILNIAQRAIKHDNKKEKNGNNMPPPLPPTKQCSKKKLLSSLDQQSVANGSTTSGCTCSSSVFSGNAAHVDFFLPKLGLACNCSSSAAGASTNTSNYIPVNNNNNCTDDNNDPRSLSNILRPWQASFLESIGITTAEQLILSTNKEQIRKIIKSMQTWRTARNMKPVKTKSCYVALHIWTRTAKVTLRSLDYGGSGDGNVITIGNDDDISTLGGTSFLCESKEI